MTSNLSTDIIELLNAEAAAFNSPDFIDSDPVQFPRRFENVADIEIASLLCSTIAWGNRKMICRNCEKMLAMMDHQPHAYVMERGFDDLPDEGNIHRTFFNANLRHYLNGLHRIYTAHPTLNDFATARHIGNHELPAWQLAEAVNNEIAMANNGKADSRCLPLNLTTTALKRFNMALRWLVRNDGIVDMGVWTAITPDRLFIPLDVHVGNTARDLGLTSRRANDKKTTIEITDTLRKLNPSDPVIYDFALFGIGIEHRLEKNDKKNDIALNL